MIRMTEFLLILARGGQPKLTEEEQKDLELTLQIQTMMENEEEDEGEEGKVNLAGLRSEQSYTYQAIPTSTRTNPLAPVYLINLGDVSQSQQVLSTKDV